MPSTKAADDELARLRHARLNASPAQSRRIGDEFEAAEKKYPNDYRFPYEHAKLLTPLPSHHEAFHTLFEAAAVAIKNDQAAEMLSDLKRDKDTDFRRLHTHKGWTQIEDALKRKDESVLPHTWASRNPEANVLSPYKEDYVFFLK